MNKDQKYISEAIGYLPNKPGVYQYFDDSDKIIYVGKAKNLKKRVSSYFNKDKHESGKTAMLVRSIAKIQHIIVANEYEALLLENSMIKQHQPKYNIQLRDDKTYPWICIKKERFPRVFPTRNVVKDGSEYYGPYASVKRMKSILEIIGKIHKIRNCNFNLSQENIEKGKFKVCLEYHIGNCFAPCVSKQAEQSYNRSIDHIRHLIKGNLGKVIKDLNFSMSEFAEKLDFENAASIKQQIALLDTYQSKSVVVNPAIENVDVVSIIDDDVFAYLNYMRVTNGAIIHSHSVEFKKKLKEAPEDLILSFVADMREVFGSDSREIITSNAVEANWDHAVFFYPQRGDKKALIDFSLRNVRFYMLERQKAQDKIDPERHSNRVMKKIQEDLRMKDLPKHIECFDNSNFHGSYPVAACVVFKNAKPFKKDYRIFNIKTVEGPDDFASMEEVVYRRYKRLIDENQKLPQLIIVDGGKGQLSSAMKSIDKLGLRGKISLVGIAKKLEEIYFPGDSIPLYIDKRSESLKVIQRLRNEAHRFGITHHRDKRSKGTFQSELLQIEGIGEKTSKQLLKEFASVERIKVMSCDELEKVVSKSAAKKIFTHFSGQ